MCNENSEKLTENLLLEEMEMLIRDEFECSIKSDGKKVCMQFANGQKFAVTVEECV